METLLNEIRACQTCINFLPKLPKPIIQASLNSKIIIIGQAPGQKVQDTGIPWNDASGNELRRWLGIEKATFYNPQLFALMPMGFCYPGKGKGGDMPPRPECAPLWHNRLLAEMKHIKLALLIGQYSQNHYLKTNSKTTLTDTVRNFNEYLPQYLPLVHPSPRNKIWQKKNPWFESEVIPKLLELVAGILK